MKIDLIAGARPNFMKISPLVDAINLSNQTNIRIQYRIIHTGQHYNKNMSNDFFDELGIPEPHFNLGVGSGSSDYVNVYSYVYHNSDTDTHWKLSKNTSEFSM